MSNSTEEVRDTETYLKCFYARRDKYFGKVSAGTVIIGILLFLTLELLHVGFAAIISIIVAVLVQEILYALLITIPAKREAWGKSPYTGWKTKYPN